MAGLRRRIVLCDDSRTYATALTRVLEHDGALDVVGVFPTAEKTLAALPALRPDLVTMDLELPGMSGLDAVEEIMASAPTPVVVLSDYTTRNSATAGAALRAGALAAIPKSEVDLRDPAGLGAATLRRRVTRLSDATVVRHPLARLRRPAGESAIGTRRSLAAIGVCASTGGPKALVELLAVLPATFPVPLLVVQHIAANFEGSLLRTLDRAIELPVGFAADGMRLQPGVWLAPQGSHLRVCTDERLERVAPDGGRHHHCPAGDVLLESLARVFGSNAAGVVLTGMGEDGAAGIGELRAAGGLAVAQDEASCAVFGMPRAALARGIELALAPEEIGRLLARVQPLRPGAETGTGTPPAEGRPRLRVVR